MSIERCLSLKMATQPMHEINIENILKKYFLRINGFHIEELKEGLTNFNYKIITADGKKYFLKIFRNAKLDRVKGIISLIHSLRKYNFPTPEIIPCLDGTFLWTDNKNISIITEFIEGSYPKKRAEDLYQIGNVLAALHQVPVKIPLINGYSLTYKNQVENIFKSKISPGNEILSFRENVDPVIRSIENLNFPVSIIHGDVFLDNLLMNDFRDLYFVDFEGGCIDHSIFDLSRAVIGCAIRQNKIDLELTRALIGGYNVVRNLEPIEHEYLYEYIIYAGAVSAFWRFNEFNIRRVNEEKRDLYLYLLNPVFDFLRMSKSEFQNKIYQKPF